MKRLLIIILAIAAMGLGFLTYYLYAGGTVPTGQQPLALVWDIVAVYQPGKLWQQTPPEPSYSGGPVVDVIDETRNAIKRELENAISYDSRLALLALHKKRKSTCMLNPLIDPQAEAWGSDRVLLTDNHFNGF